MSNDNKLITEDFVDELGDLLEKHGLTAKGEFFIHYEFVPNGEDQVCSKRVGLLGARSFRKRETWAITQRVLLSVIIILVGILCYLTF